MQFASSGTLEEVQAFVAATVAAEGGVVTAQSPSVTTATFTKRFAWLTFIALMVLFGTGLIYLVWWFVKKDQTLTLTYRVQEGVVYVTTDASGDKAKDAEKRIAKAFR